MPPAAPRAPPSAPQLDAQTLTPTRASRGEAGGRARRGRAPTSDGKPAPTCAGKGAWGHLDMEASPVQRAFLEEAAPSQQVSSNREGTSDSHSQGVQSRELPPPPWLPQGGGCNSYAHQNCPPPSSPGERTEPGIQWEGAGRTLRVGLMGLPGRHKPPAARPQGGRPGTTPRTVQGSEQSWASRGSQSQAGTCRPGPCIPPVGHPGPQQSSPQFCSISGEQALALQNQADVL